MAEQQVMKLSADGQYRIEMVAFQVDLLVYASFGTSIHVFRKIKSSPGQLGFDPQGTEYHWIPWPATNIVIKNVYTGKLPSERPAANESVCSAQNKDSLDCLISGGSGHITVNANRDTGYPDPFETGNVDPNKGLGGTVVPDTTAANFLNVKAVSGIAQVTVDGMVYGLRAQVGENLQLLPPDPPSAESTAFGNRIDCVSVDKAGDIKTIGGSVADGTSWTLTLKQAIKVMEDGHFFFVERPDGAWASVVLATRKRQLYIKTSADHHRTNNLLSLPTCERM